MTDWSQIVEQHGPLVWRTIQRLLSHEADAADCFQRTFVAAWELSRSEPVRHWPALLRRLATARAIESMRVRLRDRSRQTTLPHTNVIDVDATAPDQAAQADELAEHLRAALTQIDQRQAEVFCLACLDGCSYDEIGEQVGVTANHVGVLLNRARASLRERLRSHAPQSHGDVKQSEIER